MGIGGTVLFLSGLCRILDPGLALWRGARWTRAAPPPAFFVRPGPWLVIAVALIVVAYVPVAVSFLSNPAPPAPAIDPY